MQHLKQKCSALFKHTRSCTVAVNLDGLSMLYDESDLLQSCSYWSNIDVILKFNSKFITTKLNERN